MAELDSVIIPDKPVEPSLDSVVMGTPDNQREGIQQSSFVASQTEPDRMGEAINLSYKHKASPFFVYDNLNQFKENDPNMDSLVDHSPGVAEFFQKPENASVGHDDLPSLQRIDQGVQHLNNKSSFLKEIKDVAIPLGFDAYQKAMIHFGNSLGLIDKDMALHQIQSIDRSTQALKVLEPNYLEAYSEALSRNQKDLGKSIDEVSGSFKTMSDSSILKGLKEAALGGTHTIGSILDYVKTMASHPKASTFKTTEGLIPFVPSLALAPTGANIGQLLFGALPVFMGSYFDRKVSESGKTLEEVYSDPNIMGDFREKSFRYGATMDLATMGLAGIAGKFAAADRVISPGIKGAANTAARVGADVAVGTGVLAAGDVSAQAAAGDKPDITGAIDMALQNLGLPLAHEAIGIAKAKLRPRETVQGEVISPENPSSAEPSQIKGEQKLLPKYAGVDPIEASKMVAVDTHNAVESLQNLQALSEMGDAVKESKLAKRVPDKIEELVQSSGGKGDVYFQVADWDQFFIEKGLSPVKAAEQILGESAKSYLEAKETGADMKIPVSTYISKVAPTEHYDGLLNIIRTKPDGMTFEESKSHIEALPETMSQIAEEAQKASMTSEQFSQYAQSNQALQDYAAQPESNSGAYVNQDIARLQHPDYASSKENKAKYIQETQAGSGVIAQKAYEAQLQKPVLGDTSFIIGGPGSGKTTAGKSTLKDLARVSDVILDGVGADYEKLKSNIQLGLDSGRDANIVFVFTPYEQALINIVKRYQEEGRPVPASVIARGHTLSIESYLKLNEDFKSDDRVHLIAVTPDFLNAEGKPSVKDLSEIQNLRYIKGDEKVEEAIQRLEKIAEESLSGTNAGVEGGIGQGASGINSSGANGPVLQAPDQVISEHQYPPLLENTEKLSPEEAEKYQLLAKGARDYSLQQLKEKVQADKDRKQSQAYKDVRSEVRFVIENQINQSPVYNALSILKNGVRADGSPLPEGQFPIKLSREAIDSEYVSGLPKGIFDKEFGVSPDFAAEALGFKSGDDLLQSIANAPEKNSVIEFLTDQKMEADYPSLSNPVVLTAEAVDAIHNEKRSQMLRMELEYLAKERMPDLKGVIRDVSRRMPTNQEVRTKAEGIIELKEIQNIKPFEFELSERKSAKEAGDLLAKGDIDGAYKAKRKELLNHELYRAAVKANEVVDKALLKFKRASESDENLAKNRDVDLVNAARALLAQYGLTKRPNKLPSEYLKAALSYEPEKFEMLNEMIQPLSAFPSNYESLSYSDFKNLKTAFDTLWSLSKTEKEITLEGKKFDVAVAAHEIKSKAQKFKNKKPTKAFLKTVSESEKKSIDFSDFLARRRTAESLIDQWDKGDITGTFRKYLFTPVNEAAERYRSAKVNPYKEIDRALKSVDLRGGKIDAPEIGYQFQDKSFLLGALLHTGNESNLSKLLRGRGLGTIDENGNVDKTRWNAFIDRMIKEGKLTKADFDFVQAIWNVAESIKPEAQKAHKEMYGYYFDEVTHTSFENKFGKYEGGYYPAKVDPYENMDARTRAEKEAFEKVEKSWQFPTTGRGFTKSRVEAYSAPLQLDLRYIKSGIDSVLRFSHLEPAVKDAAKLLIDPEIRSAINEMDPYAIRNVLTPFLQRAATQIVTHAGENRFMDRFLKRMKSATQLQLLFLDVSNALQQLGGLSTAAIKVSPSHLRNAFFEFLQHPKKTTAWVVEKSGFMKNHASDQLTNIEESIEDMTVNPNTFDKIETYTKKSANFLSRMTQHVVDMTVWMGAYSEAIQKELDDKQAIRSADSAVRLTQGSAFPEHLSTWASGSQGAAIFKIFTNYFLMQNNLLSSEWAKASEKGHGWGRKAYVAAIAALVPTLFSVFIRQILSGHPDKNDDDSYADDYLKQSIMGSIGTAASIAAPGGGNVAYSVMNALTNKNPASSNLSLSPVFSVAEKSVKGIAELSNAFQKRKALKGREIQDIFTLLGLATNLPLAPVSRPFSYGIDVVNRNIKPPSNPADLVRGLVTGQGSPRKK